MSKLLDKILYTTQECLDPTLDPANVSALFTLDEPLDFSPPLDVGLVLGDEEALGEIVALWPELYPREDIEEFLRRHHELFPKSVGMHTNTFCLLNPMLSGNQVRYMAIDNSEDPELSLSKWSLFLLESYFLQNVNASDFFLSMKTFRLLATMTSGRLSWWIEKYQDGHGYKSKEGAQKVRQVVAEWLATSSVESLRTAGEDFKRSLEQGKRLMRVGLPESEIAAMYKAKAFSRQGLLDALQHSILLRKNGHSGTRPEVFEMFVRLAWHEQVGWNPEDWGASRGDVFVAFYQLAVEEMQRLADLLGQTWTPPLSRVL